MGAWGSGAFENDSALDWVSEFLDGGDLEAALALPDENTYVEVDEGSAALAAAEVVAAFNGHSSKGLPDDLVAYVAASPQEPTEALTTLALRAIDRVMGKQSELKDLWDDEPSSQWAHVVEDLRRRLSAPPRKIR